VGDVTALNELFTRCRDRLKRMVRLRMNPRLRGRVDDSDVVQDAFVEAARRLPEYLEQPQTPFFLWVRQIVGQRLIDTHRRHMLSKQRDAGRDISLFGGAPLASSASLAAQLLGRASSPSQAAIKAETRLRVQQALEAMNEIDREVLTLRHFERLSNAEAAEVIGIDPSACSNRYIRAVKRMKRVLHARGDAP
jgi:RNA polymerase sigma-70 factor (ECF subfamily)